MSMSYTISTRVDIPRGEFMPNTFHVALTVHDIPVAVEQYRKLLGIEPAKVRRDYAKADTFRVRDADGIPWEMQTLLEEVEAETAAGVSLRSFLDQHNDVTTAIDGECATGSRCCVPDHLASR
jgi:catechol 2,3-dioxygenase-like lactoylglutathione lyase family enzyme